MVKIILFIDNSNEQLKLSQTILDILKKYVESQGEEGKIVGKKDTKIEKKDTCHKCGW